MEPVRAEIVNAKSDGQATGVAMKHLKGLSLNVQGQDVAVAWLDSQHNLTPIGTGEPAVLHGTEAWLTYCGIPIDFDLRLDDVALVPACEVVGVDFAEDRA